MDRLTKKKKTEGNAERVLKDGVTELEAVERLALYEDMYEALLEELGKTEEKLDELKKQNKTKTVAFRQLLGDKLRLSEIAGRIELWIK